MKIWISGAAGYMGRVVAEEAVKQDIAVVGGVDRVPFSASMMNLVAWER